ncbi:histone-lysine N-methyltransferase family member SUVH9-like [Amphibalanus amphitrite]|uniref:histone-lysine N-methyltransferase family member SUVH9-like n=1 Tax=Amphibalanus amphitrite TaxID=1232801 RepID=UPI001C9006A6|nr:histone-lysine N-methyltransferase family member SUVH9-like [Amphibalanus amphitrite]XP_043230633.1 histone-lysine N-methyltransferase family member SUVH9-like [Amphibalanus amphitrite]XP_043230634.1 histone-lysine N-methyltransferase family member SUVH9-like [Amphibalanus amphitrite]XP_043230635.1 histone-lysine N-methyltransferase family member SUVH9-like [Amphibalanus amphitrite]XP_043230636.1 histone-lysine N-methyltransferase family member SUVH9-like [Amphibalanus amphitrite]XP_0432306
MPGKVEALSELEKLQQQNREANRKVLQELGLLEPLPPLRSAIRVKKRPAPAIKSRPAKRPRPQPERDDAEYGTELTEGRRRSTRQSNKPVKFSSLDYGSDVEDDSDDEDYDDEGGRRRARKPYTPRIRVSVPKNRENVYGAIPGVAVGTWWQTRLECCADGIHRPTVAGIHSGPSGAYSIALSGGYEDDLDWGECFTYTGEGGRDLKGTAAQPKNLRTAPQSKNQELTRGNLALTKNVETRTPVRVIRGYKLQSPYAPEEGYRYDGLYWVEKFWLCRGQSGFMVYKYAMKRCEDQPPPPWESGADGDSASCDEPTSENEEEKEEEEKENKVSKAKRGRKGQGRQGRKKEAKAARDVNEETPGGEGDGNEEEEEEAGKEEQQKMEEEDENEIPFELKKKENNGKEAADEENREQEVIDDKIGETKKAPAVRGKRGRKKKETKADPTNVLKKAADNVEPTGKETEENKGTAKEEDDGKEQEGGEKEDAKDETEEEVKETEKNADEE